MDFGNEYLDPFRVESYSRSDAYAGRKRSRNEVTLNENFREAPAYNRSHRGYRGHVFRAKAGG